MSGAAVKLAYKTASTFASGYLQSMVEIGVDKNTTVVFPAPLMSTIGELGAFLAREAAAAKAAQPQRTTVTGRTMAAG